MHLLQQHFAAASASASQAEPLRLPRERCRWLRLQPLSLPLELAFWALWHCRHARPPDSTAR
ncbi:hypothetical protein [Pseudomonas citronellolis]|uniref:hypothetical protein n=1 Tax=Pseudomonas citronellolis TaxID=53408 RepID=UPI000778AB1C|nr:hypothetical protein [Pseudomonas citronellolis]AMO76908.1 hypothetical protein PcP3B5_34910 [Pseudomonas citronellolis]WAB91363.1 hypothetical protein OSS47_25050 [Pseudomonas citronellolis]WRT81397.1 hypothetical protein VK748_23575 [Pseudomonas citronellolis]